MSEDEERSDDSERSMRPVTAEEDDGRAVLRVVRGAPTEEELAALVAVLATRARTAPAPAAAPRSLWRDRSRNIRPAIGPGPGAWRASGQPR